LRFYLLRKFQKINFKAPSLGWKNLRQRRRALPILFIYWKPIVMHLASAHKQQPQLLSNKSSHILVPLKQ
jgi:hypothetical protein